MSESEQKISAVRSDAQCFAAESVMLEVVSSQVMICVDTRCLGGHSRFAGFRGVVSDAHEHKLLRHPTNKERMDNTDMNVSASEIFTTIRHDYALRGSSQNTLLSSQSGTQPTAWYMFQFHLDRLRASAGQFQCVQPSQSIDHLALLDKELQNQISAQRHLVESDLVKPAWRVRLILDSEGGIKIDQLKPVASLSRDVLYPDTLDPPSQLRYPLYELFLCPHPTKPTSFTRHKTAKREAYTTARLACDLPAEPTADPVEVLLWNPAGELMEGSLTSVYCRENEHWFTPAVTCGGNEGTTRRWAIENGLCTEGVIMVENLIEGQIVCISNGIRGFIHGVVKRKFFNAARRSAAS